MKKSIFITLVACLLCIFALSGCTIIEVDPSTYPTMPETDYSGQDLTNVETDRISTLYTADSWSVQEDAALLTLMLTDTIDDPHIVNITVQVSSEYEGPFSSKDRNDLYRVFSSTGYTVFDKFELRRLNGEVIIYIEAVTEFTEKLIDKLVEQGMLTQASIDAMGGRDTLLALPKTYQTMIYTIQDGYICVYTGTCYSEEQIQPVLDQMLILIDNTQVRPVS